MNKISNVIKLQKSVKNELEELKNRKDALLSEVINFLKLGDSIYLLESKSVQIQSIGTETYEYWYVILINYLIFYWIRIHIFNSSLVRLISLFWFKYLIFIIKLMHAFIYINFFLNYIFSEIERRRKENLNWQTVKWAYYLCKEHLDMHIDFKETMRQKIIASFSYLNYYIVLTAGNKVHNILNINLK